ncbi:MAG: acetolactate synthase, large subunit, biosynthetic type, partial [Acidaminococcaceae bacterium]
MEYQPRQAPLVISPVLPEPAKVQQAIKAVNQASRPVLLIGGGVINANAEYAVMALAEKLNLPVVSTLMGLGACSAYRQTFLGMTGMHGHQKAN